MIDNGIEAFNPEFCISSAAVAAVPPVPGQNSIRERNDLCLTVKHGAKRLSKAARRRADEDGRIVAPTRAHRRDCVRPGKRTSPSCFRWCCALGHYGVSSGEAVSMIQTAEPRHGNHLRMHWSSLHRLSASRGSVSVCQPRDFLIAPNVIGNSSSHRWRDPQRLVNPSKVVVDKVQRHGSGVVFHLL